MDKLLPGTDLSAFDLDPFSGSIYQITQQQFKILQHLKQERIRNNEP